MTTVALVPAKLLTAAKSRLAGVLEPSQRAEIALDMLRAVLEQLRRMPGIVAFAVVTGDERARELALRFGAEIVPEPSDGLNLALDAGRAWAVARRADALLVVLSDLPLLRAADLESLLATPAAVVIAPSNDGGTNALLLRPPGAIPFRFGRDSARYHRFEAEKRRLEVAFVRRDSLAFDVDTPADLEAYRAARSRALARP